VVLLQILPHPLLKLIYVQVTKDFIKKKRKERFTSATSWTSQMLPPLDFCKVKRAQTARHFCCNK